MFPSNKVPSKFSMENIQRKTYIIEALIFFLSNIHSKEWQMNFKGTLLRLSFVSWCWIIWLGTYNFCGTNLKTFAAFNNNKKELKLHFFIPVLTSFDTCKFDTLAKFELECFSNSSIEDFRSWNCKIKKT